jgi:hypothetical protein
MSTGKDDDSLLRPTVTHTHRHTHNTQKQLAVWVVNFSCTQKLLTVSCPRWQTVTQHNSPVGIRLVLDGENKTGKLLIKSRWGFLFLHRLNGQKTKPA